jgi:hypothetical protein
VLKQEVDK